MPDGVGWRIDDAQRDPARARPRLVGRGDGGRARRRQRAPRRAADPGATCCGSRRRSRAIPTTPRPRCSAGSPRCAIVGDDGRGGPVRRAARPARGPVHPGPPPPDRRDAGGAAGPGPARGRGREPHPGRDRRRRHGHRPVRPAPRPDGRSAPRAVPGRASTRSCRASSRPPAAPARSAPACPVPARRSSPSPTASGRSPGSRRRSARPPPTRTSRATSPSCRRGTSAPRSSSAPDRPRRKRCHRARAGRIGTVRGGGVRLTAPPRLGAMDGFIQTDRIGDQRPRRRLAVVHRPDPARDRRRAGPRAARRSARGGPLRRAGRVGLAARQALAGPSASTARAAPGRACRASPAAGLAPLVRFARSSRPTLGRRRPGSVAVLLLAAHQVGRPVLLEPGQLELVGGLQLLVRPRRRRERRGPPLSRRPPGPARRGAAAGTPRIRLRSRSACGRG